MKTRIHPRILLFVYHTESTDAGTCDGANLVRDGSSHCKLRRRDAYDVAVRLRKNKWLLLAPQSGGGLVRRPL